MKQVKLKIEEMFDNEIVTAYKTEHNELMQPIRMIFNRKIYSSNISMSKLIYKLKPNESRETIIKAIWELQKSLLPQDSYLWKDSYIYSEKITYAVVHTSIQKTFEFYDPATRIITITYFEEQDK